MEAGRRTVQFSSMWILQLRTHRLLYPQAGIVNVRLLAVYVGLEECRSSELKVLEGSEVKMVESPHDCHCG